MEFCSFLTVESQGLFCHGILFISDCRKPGTILFAHIFLVQLVLLALGLKIPCGPKLKNILEKVDMTLGCLHKQ